MSQLRRLWECTLVLALVLFFVRVVRALSVCVLGMACVHFCPVTLFGSGRVVLFAAP